MRGLPQPIIDQECVFLAKRLTADKAEACLGLEAVTMMREVAAMIRDGRVSGILRANRWSDFAGLFEGN